MSKSAPTVGAPRRPVWSSPPSPLRTAPSPTWSPTTGYRGPGSMSCSARYRTEGDAAFEPRSRRPHTSPNATPAEVVELIVLFRKELIDAGLDAGAGDDRLAPDPPPPDDGVESHDPPDPDRSGVVTPDPSKTTEVLLPPVRGRDAQRVLAVRLHPLPAHSSRRPPRSDVEIITWLDDHSRYALHVTAHQPVTAKTVLTTFRQATDLHGYPASTLTDNGMVYTVRLAGHGRGGGQNAFEAELRRLDIVQKNSRHHDPPPAARSNDSNRP